MLRLLEGVFAAGGGKEDLQQIRDVHQSISGDEKTRQIPDTACRQDRIKGCSKGRRHIMSKIAVVYWSGTGNTAAMAKAVEDGAKSRGAALA